MRINPAYATSASLDLNSSISPISAMILAARLGPIPSMLEIYLYSSKVEATVIISFNVFSHSLCVSITLSSNISNISTSTSSFSHPGYVFSQILLFLMHILKIPYDYDMYFLKISGNCFSLLVLQ